MNQPSSNLFEGYKSVGHVTGPLPFIVRHGKNPQDTRIVTIDIKTIASDEGHIFSASGGNVMQWGRGSKKLIKRLGQGHQADVRILLKLGPNKLITVDEDNVLFNWHLKDSTLLNVITFDDGTFKISAVCQPHTYKDKCLLGSDQGQLQLWNIATETCLFKFKGWESKVTCLTQSPVVDVVGIGLEDGHVYVHNLRYDEVLMKIYQEYGSITSMSFRLDNQPYLVTASPIGHLMIWNLERKRLSSQIRYAHQGPVSKCQFVRNEPLLITAGDDNCLKVWSMDMSDGGGNLLSQRSGHSAPPSQIKFYGPKGFNLLSAGNDSTMKMFHIYSERMSKNLGTAKFARKSRNKQNKEDPTEKLVNNLPPITCFAAEIAKEKQWDNIAACHQGSSLVTTWNYDKCRQGEFVIQQPTFNKHEVVGSSICITSCGNFVIIGFSNGLIFKYNIQSGMFRQYYERSELTDHRAHDGKVTSVNADALDLVMISSGVDKKLNLWHFKDGRLLAEVDLSAPILKTELHRENNLMALALDNNSIEIMDLETKVLVRRFPTSSRILDMTFSPDSRWLIAALEDKSIRTWDLHLGKLIDAFRLSDACTSLSLSSTGEFLATAHANSLGINIWCNFTIYCPTPLRPISESHEELPPILDMPFVRDDEVTKDGDEQELEAGAEVALPDERDLMDVRYVSPEQLDSELITLSGLPSSRWHNLLNIEELRRKQLIEEESKKEKQVKVPFFIPVKDGLNPKLDAEAVAKLNGDDEHESLTARRSKISQLELLSPLAKCLLECRASSDYNDFLTQLRELGPSATDAEIRSLGKDTCGDIQPMLCFLDAMDQNLKQNTDYELTSSWLAVYLKAHSDLIQTDAKLKERCAELLEPVGTKWDRLHDQFNQIFCVLNFVRSSIL